MDKVRETYKCFTGVTFEGFSGQMLYYQKCDHNDVMISVPIEENDWTRYDGQIHTHL